jgi:hypothetical protein
MPEQKLPRVVTEIRVCKEITAGVRTIFIVVRISTLESDDGKILGSWIMPWAMLIVEPERQYGIDINGEQISIETILEAAPSLKEILEKAREIHRIRVD